MEFSLFLLYFLFLPLFCSPSFLIFFLLFHVVACHPPSSSLPLSCWISSFFSLHPSTNVPVSSLPFFATNFIYFSLILPLFLFLHAFFLLSSQHPFSPPPPLPLLPFLPAHSTPSFHLLYFFFCLLLLVLLQEESSYDTKDEGGAFTSLLMLLMVRNSAFRSGNEELYSTGRSYLSHNNPQQVW